MRFEISNATQKGRRYYQEDRRVVHSTPEGYLLAIFDGHGGEYASERCAAILIDVFDIVVKKAKSTKPVLDSVDFRFIIQEIFEVLKKETENYSAGTTASIVFVSKYNWAVAGILGDSPVLIKTLDGSIWLSPEHNVRTNAEDCERAQALGASISGGYMFATWFGSGLQMTRALGDKEFDKVLNRNPEIFRFPLKVGSFVLVASDGVFDPSHGSHKSAEITKKIEDGWNAKRLVQDAVDEPTQDNATAILLKVLED